MERVIVNMRIGVNCGHTVSGQPGCGAVDLIDESVETRAVGKYLIKFLRDFGHTVVDCTNDYAPSTSSNLSQIVDMANKQPLDLFISIHFNAGGGRGTEVYTYGGQSFEEAENVCKRLQSWGFTNRGIKDGSNLYVICKTDAKAMLIEVCFVDTSSDVELYKQIGPLKLAMSICGAITHKDVSMETENEESEDDEMTNAEFETRLKALEEKVGQGHEVYNYVDDNMPKWIKDDVQWMLDRKILVGDEDGKLGLNPIKLWTIAIIVRTARYIGKHMNMKL